ncbi:MAG TPA: penicillin-binding protein 2, partial [Dehalococcoidia bacterium]|nr:penicillin-binding protein 2 [Dehalococcoidia bacterium]
MRWIAAPLFLSALVLVAAACGPGGAKSGSGPAPRTPKETAERFLSLWQQRDYAAMYDLVSAEARTAIDEEKFVGRYSAIADEATIAGIDYELAPAPAEGTPAPSQERTPASGNGREVPVKLTFHTSFFGDIAQENVLPLVKEAVAQPASPEATPKTRDEWRVQWTPALIFKELDDRSLVHFFTKVPRRGGIYDRNGAELAVDAQVSVVGIVPESITDKEAVISSLAGALGIPESEVRAQVEANVPSYYFVPVKRLAYGTPPEALQKFYDMAGMGVVVREETLRVYPQGSMAAHVLGYMTEVTEEQLKTLAAKGYKPGDRVGASGLEGQFDEVLAGERGGTLATVTPEGTIGRTIAEKPSTPGKDIYLALDVNVQRTAEQALGERVGSMVAIDPRDNSVLALASSPRFDPNAFIRGLTAEEFASLSNDPRQPFLHRPLLATYPPGSTFKVVTTAAGLEKGGFTPGSTFHCVPVWTGLGADFPKNNWQSVDRGYLTPAQGLMASCNPVFYEMALALDHIDENILPQFARAFGYGQLTGINALDEAPGVVPDPKWKEENKGESWFSGDSVNMGIGQGFMLVTPLQIANAYSAIADGGVLRKPLLVKKIAEPGGAVAQEFTAEQINALPVSSSTLDTIREGLSLVTHSAGGTSYQVFAGASVDAAGKSGTAEDLAFGANHVFFVAYANRSEPSIVALAAL